MKAGLEDRKAPLLVALAGLSDGRKVVLALQAGPRESTESWPSLLRDLRARRLVIGDGHLGLWGALWEVYPESAEQRWCRGRGYEEAAVLIEADWERMTAFYAFPRAHWPPLRTTNPVESPFAALRLRTDAAKRFKKVENATAVIWRLLLIAESRFRRLNAPELLTEVFQGAFYVSGVRVANDPARLAA